MMMSQVARALNATLHGNDVLMTGVSKDTRDINVGDLYVALKGERFDGHQFIESANSSGAVGALVSDLQIDEKKYDIPQVKVDDTRLALGRLAAHWCQQWRKKSSTGKLIGITGSNGKTSVKEMCRKILTDSVGEPAVLSTKGNLNNDIGLPMMLLELEAKHEFAVIEMGANHIGEIDYLTSIAKPDVAIVNNVGPAHLEGFGSLENTAKTKAEIFNGLSKQGIAVINLDDAFASYWQKFCEDKKVCSFSMQHEQADVFAKKIADNRYFIVTEQEKFELSLKVPGKHNVMNALAATAATLSVGVPLSSIVNSLSEFENITGRLTTSFSDMGYRVIDDTYNANPLSVSAAIDVLAGLPGNRILVLGDMGELGESANKMHADVGCKAKEAGVDSLYATGELSVDTVKSFGENGFHFRTKKELVSALQEKLTENDIVLVKGSRSAAMEEVVERILTHNNNSKRVN